VIEAALRGAGETVWRIGHIAASAEAPRTVLRNAETQWPG